MSQFAHGPSFRPADFIELMITGLVTPPLEALIPLTVAGPRGRVTVVEAFVDTGYDGHMTFPPQWIRKLRLPWKRRGRAEWADGSESVFDVHAATVSGDRRVRLVVVDEAMAAPLVGMRLFAGFEF